MMTTPLYVFDLDETLLDGDSAMIWNAFLVEKGLINDPDFIKKDTQMMVRYAKGELAMDEYLAFSMAPIADKSKFEIAELVEECVRDKVLSRIFPHAFDLIAQLKKQGHTMIIVSATVSFIVDSVAKQLGIANSIGIELVEDAGRYTAKIFGTPSYQYGKVIRLEAWMDSQAQLYHPLHFYTDSINDLPMCEYADYAYLVNPCRRLLQHTDQQPWSVLHWQRDEF